jgi:hypothetical protein
MYHGRTAWRLRFLWAKNMDAAKDIHKEMLQNISNLPTAT